MPPTAADAPTSTLTTSAAPGDCGTAGGPEGGPGLLAPADAARLARTLKAIADPTRLQLLAFLARSPNGEACVCDLTTPVGLSQPTVSHHLKKLVDAGLLTREQRGVWAYYSLTPHATRPVADELTAICHPHLPG